MIRPIAPEKLYLILPFKVSQLAVLLSKQLDISSLKALQLIYKSETYRQLENEKTKLWHLGPVALLEYYNEHH